MRRALVRRLAPGRAQQATARALEHLRDETIWQIATLCRGPSDKQALDTVLGQILGTFGVSKKLAPQIRGVLVEELAVEDILRNKRYDADHFINAAIIPDFHGGYRAIELGQTFTRTVKLADKGHVETGALMEAVRDDKKALTLDKEALSARWGGSRERSLTSRAVFATLSSANYYGAELLTQVVRERGACAEMVYVPLVPGKKCYIDQFASAVRASAVPDPNVIGISVVDYTIEDAIELIRTIRREFPHAYVLIGGATTQYAEQLAVLLDDFDIIVKGNADDVIVDILGIIGESRRGEGLTPERIERLAALEGGIIARSGNTLLYNNVAHMNRAPDFRMLKPAPGKFLYYWHNTRGCLQNCAFCNKWGGQRYDLAVPYETELKPPGASAVDLNAASMKEWMLECLLNFKGSGTTAELERELEAAQRSGSPLALLPPGEKIRIMAYDDDFLTDRARMEALHAQMMRLGLQDYFEISCIARVNAFWRHNDIDHELVGWLVDMGFKGVYLGTDGLCDGVLKENNKGYPLSRAIAVNKALLDTRRPGSDMPALCPYHNVVWTSPRTTRREIVESFMLRFVLPFRFNELENHAVLAELANHATNQHAVDACGSYTSVPQKGFAAHPHYDAAGDWRIPVKYPRYAIPMPGVELEPREQGAQQLYRRLLADYRVFMEPSALSSAIAENIITLADIEEVLLYWKSSPDEELNALAFLYRAYQQPGAEEDPTLILLDIKNEMLMAGTFSFADHRRNLLNKTTDRGRLAAALTQYSAAVGDADTAGTFGALKTWSDYEAVFRQTIRDFPFFINAHYNLAMSLIAQNRLADAVEVINEAYDINFANNLRTDALSRCVEAFGNSPFVDFDTTELAWTTTREGVYEPQIAMYLLCGVVDIARGALTVNRIDLRLNDIVRARAYYEHLDALTMPAIKRELARDKDEIQRRLAAAESVLICGIPVRLEGGSLIFDIDAMPLPAQPVISTIQSAIDGSASSSVLRPLARRERREPDLVFDLPDLSGGEHGDKGFAVRAGAAAVNRIFLLVREKLRWSGAERFYIERSLFDDTVEVYANQATLPAYEAIINALFHGRGGRLELFLPVAEGDQLEIRVADHGSGVSNPQVFYEQSMAAQKIITQLGRSAGIRKGMGYANITDFPEEVIIDSCQAGVYHLRVNYFSGVKAT
ncbi:MAG: hypothetical protein WCG78_07550, partial [Candidatus Omnitrophota bacterium]